MIRKCKVCGASYKTCYSCEIERSWRLHTDTIEHYCLWLALMEYQQNHDAKQAYDAICRRGAVFQNRDKFAPGVQELLSEIESLANEDCNCENKTDEAGVEEAEYPVLDGNSE